MLSSKKGRRVPARAPYVSIGKGWLDRSLVNALEVLPPPSPLKIALRFENKQTCNQLSFSI